jgi:hypothetical protein
LKSEFYSDFINQPKKSYVMRDQMQHALIVKQNHEKNWLRLKGVVAVGIGMVEDKTGIIVSVENDAWLTQNKIPSSVDNVPIKVQTVGRIEAF